MTEIQLPNPEPHLAELRQKLDNADINRPEVPQNDQRSSRRRYTEQAVEQAVANIVGATVDAIVATHLLPQSYDAPLPVYHYTSVDAAIAMLKSDQKDAFLRMYSSAGFNAPQRGHIPLPVNHKYATSPARGLDTQPPTRRKPAAA